MSTGIITTIAGNWIDGFNGENLQASSASLRYPQGIALGAFGKIYFVDTHNNRIRIVNQSTGMITTIATTNDPLEIALGNQQQIFYSFLWKKSEAHFFGTTQTPTAAPSPIHTAVPTHVPTLIPTPVQRPVPTFKPTLVRTAIPTAVPSPHPIAPPASSPLIASTTSVIQAREVKIIIKINSYAKIRKEIERRRNICKIFVIALFDIWIGNFNSYFLNCGKCLSNWFNIHNVIFMVLC